jgi:mRNA interferase RelE/StbE
MRRLQEEARPQGVVKLKGVTAYRVRVGDYRIIYSIDDSKQEIHILAVGHRSDVYR